MTRDLATIERLLASAKARGDDVMVPVPPGTIVRDQAGRLAGELSAPGQRMLVARGGRPGRGNEHFKTARLTYVITSPHHDGSR